MSSVALRQDEAVALSAMTMTTPVAALYSELRMAKTAASYARLRKLCFAELMLSTMLKMMKVAFSSSELKMEEAVMLSWTGRALAREQNPRMG